MGRHITTGVEAVIDSARASNYNPDTLWVDTSDVVDALEQIQKLTERSYPNVGTFTHATDVETEGNNRVALRVE